TLWVGRRVIDTQNVDGAMWLALVGVVCMGVGMRVRLTPLPPSRQLELDDRPNTWFYIRWLLIAGTFASMAPGATNLLGPNFRHIMEILLTTVPTVALLLLLRKCLTDKGSRLDRGVLWLYFPVRILGGLASGWLGSVTNVGLICGVMYIVVRRKIPWTT